MDDFQFHFAASRWWCVFLCVVYFCGLLHLAMQALPVLIQLTLAILILAAGIVDFYRMKQQQQVWGIKLHAQQWYIMAGGQSIPVDLTVYLRLPCLVILSYRKMGQANVSYRCVWRDALNLQHWQILLVYLSLQLTTNN